MKPPYEITNKILSLIVSISEKIGQVNAAHLNKSLTELRKRNRIKTVQSSLEIKGNKLTVEQISDFLENKRIIAPKKDIVEVKNAISVYHQLNNFKVFQLKSLCKAHEISMKDLIENSGKMRTSSVGIGQGSNIAHNTPPVALVYSLMTDLFKYLKNDD